jgi:quercetin dioxygenase-like cupin family protein
LELQYEKEASDARGRIIFLSYGNKNINLVEIKKGFSRGGHYHEFASTHHLLSGTIKYREKNLDTNIENIRVICAPEVIHVPARTAHLLTALEDTMFAEELGDDYSATDYPEYRMIVMQNMP